MMKDRSHIMLIDSGAGGLSIARTILDLAPAGLHLSYFADRSAFPYGNKDETFLIQHLGKLIGEFIQQHNPDLIVVACNTASTIALPELRSRFNCPFVGVVPAIKPAASISISKAIGVLATPATVNRDYTTALIKEFAPNCKVALYGSDTLVRCAENYVNGLPLNKVTVNAELQKLLNQQPDIDTVVLACTHFPLIESALKEAAPQIRFWVDSSAAIARRTFDLLAQQTTGSTHIQEHHTLEVFVNNNPQEGLDPENVRENYKGYLKQFGPGLQL